MTVLEFWGCSLITFGPALAMFCLTVAPDPIKVILLICSAFFWLLSFLSAAIFWSIISLFCDYLIVGAFLAVLSQELFRYLFHIVTKKAQVFLKKILSNDQDSNTDRSFRTNHIKINDSITEFEDRIPLSYVSGLGFGLMSAAFSLMNTLTDHIGPGTVGLKGDSPHFLLVSALTGLAFILLNVGWSVMMSESIEKSDKRLAMVVISTHLMVTSITFFNRINLQFLSLFVVYSTTLLCGLAALRVAGCNLQDLVPSRPTNAQHLDTIAQESGSQ